MGSILHFSYSFLLSFFFPLRSFLLGEGGRCTRFKRLNKLLPKNSFIAFMSLRFDSMDSFFCSHESFAYLISFIYFVLHLLSITQNRWLETNKRKRKEKRKPIYTRKLYILVIAEYKNRNGITCKRGTFIFIILCARWDSVFGLQSQSTS